MSRDVVEESVPRPTGLLLTSASLAVFSVYAALRTPTLMANFRELFKGFGADLPPLTKLVLDAPSFWWVIAAPAVLVFIWIARKSLVTPRERQRMRRAVMATIVFSCVVYGLVVYAVYIPIFKLGETI